MDVMLGNEEDFTAALGSRSRAGESLGARIRQLSGGYREGGAAFPTPAVATRAPRQDGDDQRLGRGLYYEARSTRRGRCRTGILPDRVGGGDSFASGLITAS